MDVFFYLDFAIGRREHWDFEISAIRDEQQHKSNRMHKKHRYNTHTWMIVQRCAQNSEEEAEATNWTRVRRVGWILCFLIWLLPFRCYFNGFPRFTAFIILFSQGFFAFQFTAWVSFNFAALLLHSLFDLFTLLFPNLFASFHFIFFQLGRTQTHRKKQKKKRETRTPLAQLKITTN